MFWTIILLEILILHWNGCLLWNFYMESIWIWSHWGGAFKVNHLVTRFLINVQQTIVDQVKLSGLKATVSYFPALSGATCQPEWLNFCLNEIICK